jgi:cytidylate kinase
MVVAIDGPAGVGKSTTAREVAKAAGFQYLNSGSFYRAITWLVLRSGVDPEDTSGIIESARACRLDVYDGAIVANGREIEAEIHTDAIDRWVAQHSAIPEVRDVVNRELKRIAGGGDVVVEGRDIQTVVFPDAEVKVFLDADVKTRALRRFNQGVSGLSLEEIEKSIAARDTVDRTKPVGRLLAANDAIIIDTSHLTIQQVCERVAEAILLQKNNRGDIRRV